MNAFKQVSNAITEFRREYRQSVKSDGLLLTWHCIIISPLRITLFLLGHGLVWLSAAMIGRTP